MEAMEMIYTRRSVRSYEDRPVEKAVLEEVLSAALMAPSWKNTQTANYMVVERSNTELWQKLLGCLPDFNARTVATAPVVIVMTTTHGRCGYEKDGTPTTKKGDKWEMFDAGIACQTLCLAAWDKGLGTCIMGIYDEDKLTHLLQVPEGQYITAVVTLGHPAQTPAAPKRKALEERVRYV